MNSVFEADENEEDDDYEVDREANETDKTSRLGSKETENYPNYYV